MDKSEILNLILQNAVWIVLLIADVFLAISIFKWKKMTDKHYKITLQELEDLSNNHCIDISCDYDGKSDMFKKIVASFEVIKQLFADNIDEIQVLITPDLAEVLVNNDANGEHKEIAIGSFGEVNGLFFQVVGGRNDIYVAKKVEMEEMKNGD